jgi:GNAT superfamily N-acetyltransferase
MPAEFRLQRAEDITSEEIAALRQLHVESFAGIPGLTSISTEWSSPEWRITTWEADKPLSNIGIVLRRGTIAGREVDIGGIGAVATLPSERPRGLASQGLAQAMEFLHDHGASFGLLVCREMMLPFYGRLGWRSYTDPVFVMRFGERVRFDLSPVMVIELGEARVEGEIDLCGPPW